MMRISIEFIYFSDIFLFCFCLVFQFFFFFLIFFRNGLRLTSGAFCHGTPVRVGRVPARLVTFHRRSVKCVQPEKKGEKKKK